MKETIFSVSIGERYLRAREWSLPEKPTPFTCVGTPHRTQYYLGNCSSSTSNEKLENMVTEYNPIKPARRCVY